MKKQRLLICLSLLIPAAFAGACSNLPKGVPELEVGIKERGIASWYGERFNGETTASGEAYDMQAMTGAHRTLPFGTVVKVTNVKNGRQVRIRINDRGPYANGRVLDLSLAAAAALDVASTGTAPVLLEVVGGHREATYRKTPFLLLAWASEREQASPLLLWDSDTESGEGWSEPWLSDSNRRQSSSRRMSLGDLILERRFRREADPRVWDPPGDGVPELEFS